MERASTPFWYSRPAGDWTEAIPIGNGRVGGLVFGGADEETIVLNETGVWCGPPDAGKNPRGPELIARMRELLFAGRVAEAEEICRTEFLDRDSDEDRSYQPLAFLRIRQTNTGTVENYRRHLELDTATTHTDFTSGDIAFSRTAFVSAVDQVLLLRLTADRPGSITLTVSADRPFGAEVTSSEGRALLVVGQAFAEGYRHIGSKFAANVRVVADGGVIEASNSHVQVTLADSVTILVAASSDYNFGDPENPRSVDLRVECEQAVGAAEARGYVALLRDHVADYQALYGRSKLLISGLRRVEAPIDKRISEAARNGDDPDLLLIYYNYCRYLLISASREGGMPMNLQGIWNPLMAAPWRSNWHLNINIQEAYWTAEVANLAECHEPLFTLVEALRRRGEVTARVMLGTTRGFATGHRTDGWLNTSPTQLPVWGMSVAGGAWCAQHLMEHYRFTQDRDFLASRALPVLRSAAEFWLDWLVPDPQTNELLSGPAHSPENSFFLPNGSVASISMGPSYEQEIAWASLSNYIEACHALSVDEPVLAEAEAAINRVALPTIGEDGRLMEWRLPYTEPEPGHRHLSHLWGMMPGQRITAAGNPDLTAAVHKSLEHRLANDYHAQGWSLGWVCCLFSRFKEGDRALNLMMQQYFSKAFPNMFVDAHGHVQVGDMMGVPMAMLEFLLQSHAGEIELLPALPRQWETGQVTGLCARGGFIVDLDWEKGHLTSATVSARTSNECKIKYAGKTVRFMAEAGQRYTLGSVGEGTELEVTNA